MGKFCNKCGKPLAVGELCTCQMGKTPVMLNRSPMQNAQRMSGGMPGQIAQGMPGRNPMQNQQGMPDSMPGQAVQGMPGGMPGQNPQGMPGRNPASNQTGMPNGYLAQNPQGNPNPTPNPTGMPSLNQAQYGQGMPGGAQYGNRQQYEYQQMQQQYQQVQQAASGYIAKAVVTFLNLIKKPVTTGKTLISYIDMSVMITMLMLQAVTSGFFILTVLAKISGVAGGYIKMPYARSFLVTVLASVALSFLLAALFMGVNHMIKNPVTYRQMLACVSVRSTMLTVTSFISIIIFLLFPAGGFFFFFCGSLWGIPAMAMIMPKNGEGVEDKTVLMQFIVYLVFLMFFGIAATICCNAYIPDVVRTLGNDINSLFQNPAAIFNEIF